MRYRITSAGGNNNNNNNNRNKKDCCLVRQKRLETQHRLNDQLNRMYEEAAQDRQKQIEYQKTIRLLNLNE
jgi:hypothetical protein